MELQKGLRDSKCALKLLSWRTLRYSKRLKPLLLLHQRLYRTQEGIFSGEGHGAAAGTEDWRAKWGVTSNCSTCSAVPNGFRLRSDLCAVWLSDECEMSPPKESSHGDVGRAQKGLTPYPSSDSPVPVQLSPKFLVAKLWNSELTESLFLWLFIASFQVFKKYFSNTSVCLVVQTLLLLQRVWAVPKLPSPHV